MAPYWAAKDAGLYKKYGLDIDLVAFPSGNEGMAAMIAGAGLAQIAAAGQETNGQASLSRGLDTIASPLSVGATLGAQTHSDPTKLIDG